MIDSRFIASVLAVSAALGSNVFAQTGTITGNTFNPAVSLILDGRYSDHHDRFDLPGFQLGGEAGLPERGFSLGHTELTISANIDDRLYGHAALAIHDHHGETETELEEAYVETFGLGDGVTLKAGRFFSHLGYLNSQHEHAWDFADAPLVYAALLGNRLRDDGIQLRWLAPTDVFLELGVEITRGDRFPAGDNDGNKGRVLFAKVGRDLGVNASWQLGASAYQSEFIQRSASAHEHQHGHELVHDHSEFALEDGDVTIVGLDAVFKWAPGDNPRARQWVLQGEYFRRSEQAKLEIADHGHAVLADYDGKQGGYYLQAIYRFMPSWRVGLRYDRIEPDNDFVTLQGDAEILEEVLQESAFDNRESIQRRTVMLDWSRSEFSRIRVQYGYLDMPHGRDELFMIQYTMSLGAHGAHRY